MRRTAISIVIGVALAASGLTATLTAGAEQTASPAKAATTVAPTPLGLRPTKPLELAEDAPRSAIGWKLGSVLLLGALGVWGWKQRSKLTPEVLAPELRILRRTSIGVRSELLVVEMDGQRLLLGVTPNTIQNLYIAPFSEDVPGTAPEVREEERVSSVTEIAPRPRASGAKRRAVPLALSDTVEEQAQGIRAFAERK